MCTHVCLCVCLWVYVSNSVRISFLCVLRSSPTFDQKLLLWWWKCVLSLACSPSRMRNEESSSPLHTDRFYCIVFAFMDYTHFIVLCSQLVYASVAVIDGTVTADVGGIGGGSSAVVVEMMLVERVAMVAVVMAMAIVLSVPIRCKHKFQWNVNVCAIFYTACAYVCVPHTSTIHNSNTVLSALFLLCSVFALLSSILLFSLCDMIRCCVRNV